MRRLSKELRKRIREMQESGMSDAEISRITGVHYSTVQYQRDEVKEKRRKYRKEYYQRKYMDPDFKEFLKILSGEEVNYASYEDNIYVRILKCLKENLGLSEKQIKRKLGIPEDKRITHKIKKLMNLKLIEDTKWCISKVRYKLTDKGEKLCKYLFEA